MSAYTVFETCMEDREVLVDSLKELGFKPEVHDEATQLTGYEGRKRQEKAEVIIPRKQVGSASNDVGFYKNSKGVYEAIISEYDRSGPARNLTDKLKSIYAEKKTMKEAAAKGYKFIGKKVVTDPKTQKPQIKLQFSHAR